MTQITLLELVQQGCPNCKSARLCLRGRKEFLIEMNYDSGKHAIQWGDSDTPLYLGHLYVSCDMCDFHATVTTRHGDPEERFLVSF